MKTIILFLFLLPFASISQDLPIVDDRIIYEKIYEYKGSSKEKIYGAAKKFIGISFKSGKSVTQSEDLNTGLIIVKGNVSAYDTFKESWWSNYRFGGTFHFTMQFDIKDERVRVRIFDIHTISESVYSNVETKLETTIFKEAKSVNKSKGKTKHKKLERFDRIVNLLNSTFYGTIESFNNTAANSLSDEW